MSERELPGCWRKHKACTSDVDWYFTWARSQNMVSRRCLSWDGTCLHSCRPLLLASAPLLTSGWPSNHIVAPKLLSWCFDVLSLADAAAGGEHHAQHQQSCSHCPCANGTLCAGAAALATLAQTPPLHGSSPPRCPTCRCGGWSSTRCCPQT